MFSKKINLKQRRQRYYFYLTKRKRKGEKMIILNSLTFGGLPQGVNFKFRWLF